jgi:uncharacterized delta-60 repeat protein
MQQRLTLCRFGTSCLVFSLICFCLFFPRTLPAQQSFSAATPPNAIVGENYAGYLFRAAGATSFVLAPSSRPLPLGLRLNRNGTLEGRATQVGIYNGIVVRASGAAIIDSRPMTILVMPASAPTTFQVESAFIATAATATSLPIGRSNGFPAPTYSLAPSSSPLPEGLRIESNKIVGISRQSSVTQNIIVRATNSGGFVDSRPFTLTVQGQSVRQGFGSVNPSLVFRNGFNGGVLSVVQQNGYYVVGGSFSSFDGRRVPPLVRISPEGRFDNTFVPRRADGTPLSFSSVRKIHRLSDDRIIVAGKFFGFYDDDENELYGEFVIRLLPEGVLDTTFRTTQLDISEIRDFSVQRDGSILIASGDDGNIIRLDSSGRLDNRFPLAFGGLTRGLRTQRDGKIIAFNDYNAITRFLPNGKVDTTFRSTFSYTFNTDIWDVVELPNGNFFVCGTTIEAYYDPLVVCAVLSPSGKMIVPPSWFNQYFTILTDPDYSDELTAKDALYGARTALALADGKILLALHGYYGFSLYRFNADYSLDSIFTPRKGTTLGAGYGDIGNSLQGMFFDTDFTACLFGNIRNYDGLEQLGMLRINTTAQLQDLNGQTPPVEATLGVPYEPFRFRAIAEPAPFYTLAKYSSPLPDGMTLSTTGVLSGSPSTTGVFSGIVVRAATGFIEQTFSTSFTITVIPAQAPTRLLAATPPVGLRGVTFPTYQLKADGSPTPTFALATASPRLPRGMTLSTSGILSGTPAVQGLNNLVVRVSNKFGFVDAQMNLRIDNPTPPTRFANEDNPTARVGTPFTYPLNVNGTAPITYKVNKPTLPLGLTLSTGGVITGIAERSGTYSNLQIMAENSAGDISTTLTIKVLPRAQDFSRTGSFDTSFAQNSRPNAPIWTILRNPDGTFIVGGEFTTLGATPLGRLARLTRTGEIDSTFNAAALGTTFNGANGAVLALARQADGNLLLGGRFTQYNGATRRGIVRLNADGTLDNSLQIGSGFANATSTLEIRALTLQQDGRILVGGNFTSYNGRSCASLIRLFPDGTLDTAFHQSGLRGVDVPAGAVALGAAPVSAIRLQSDGKIIVAGAFTGFFMPSFVERRGILRLNTDGSLDTSFRVIRGASSPGNSFVSDVDVRGDSLMAVGNFSFYEYTGVGNVTRLDKSGGLELTSNIEQSGASEALQPNTPAFPTAIIRRAGGNGVLIGNFRRFNGEPWNGLLPLLPDGRTLPISSYFGSSENFGFGNNSSGAFTGYPIAGVIEPSDNAMVVVGGFSHYDGAPQTGIVRISLAPLPIVVPFAATAKNSDVQTSTQTSVFQTNQSAEVQQIEVTVAPNPFNDIAELRVQLPEQGFISLTLYDALGRCIAILGEGMHDKGEHRFQLQSSYLKASGIYRWHLQTASDTKSGVVSFVR